MSDHESRNLTADENENLDTLFGNFQRYVEPKLNSVFKRYQFNNIGLGEKSIEEFVTNLRIAANDCKFNNNEEIIRGRIILWCEMNKYARKASK